MSSIDLLILAVPAGHVGVAGTQSQGAFAAI